ncbi:thyrotropin-releasing hormone receptor-like [Patiria miniata]|uniref:G-protein coupled receptors family 1 profile domain-containing protein n=1 Tax=Patiria miniata TaxID=46514 RepID=A0A914AZV5_PATMI|nr:thyrotropin-releasing hormone receptor-like [Patiria miniata]
MAALESNPSWIECVSTNSSTLVVNGTLTVDDGGRVNHGRWLMIVVAIGLLANFAFLLVVARCESMRNVTNVYLANLAIADIIVLIVCAIPLVSDTSPFSTKISGCVFLVFATTPYYSSMSIVSLVAWGRFCAICKPIKHRATSSVKQSMRLVAAAWLSSLVYCVVVYLERIITSEKCEVYGVTSPNNPLIESCNKTHGFNPSPSLSDVFKVLPFVLCLSMNCWLYARIVKTSEIDLCIA